MTAFISFPKKAQSAEKKASLVSENSPQAQKNSNTRLPSSKQQLTYAHGWLGIISSSLLCLIFWFGGLSLFRAEIQAWSEAPTMTSLASNQPSTIIQNSAFEGPFTLFDAIEKVIPAYEFDRSEHLSIALPQPAQPYYQFYIDLMSNDPKKHPMVEIKVDPLTGEVLGGIDHYPLANFFYHLHYSGNMGKTGLYLIGLFALLLGFALFSGIWIQAKKLWQQFFLCRSDRKAARYLDSHRVIGVISLPFAAMFALTGLIFNLVIVYQVTFALVLYNGDSKALLADAGYATHLKAEDSGIKMSMESVPELIQQATEEKGPVEFVRIHAYGDQNAMLELKGRHHDANLASEYRRFYRISNQEVLFDGGVRENQLQTGLNTLERLHFGDFGGLGLKVIYFLLSVAVVAMVVMGNLLWVEKRKKQAADHSVALWFIPKMTMGVCLGLLGATFASMLYVRLISLEVGFSGDTLPVIFIVSVTTWMIAGFILDAIRPLIKYSLLTFSLLIGATVLMGVVQYPSDWLLLPYTTSKAILTIDVGLVLLLGVFLLIAFHKSLNASPKNVA